MKVINVFAQIFAIFAFLTLGSLLLIVSLHVLSVEDAIFKVRQMYSSPMDSLQVGLVGLFFIFVGLVFSKMLVKRGRESDAIIYQSDIGPMIVSVSAIEDMTHKILKKYSAVKSWKLKTLVHGKDLELRVRLVLWAGNSVTELLPALQGEIGERVRKILGPENGLEVLCEVHRVDDRDSDPNRVPNETLNSHS